MKYLFLNEIISEKITGDWGDEGDKVNVLRTTNFTNDGVIDYSNVVTRDIPEKVIERKKLVQGDVIIEKSGGGPSQPVGRVVYFERKDEVFLCNNFTAILRSNDLVFPKYLFYFLFSLHKLGITLKFQNKTTGIINLQLDKYLNRIQIPILPLPEQKRIAEILDKADALCLKNKQLLAAYDELLQSTFLDMFGDPVMNSKKWKKKKIGEFGDWKSGGTPLRSIKEYYKGDIPWLSSGELENMLVADSNEHITERAILESAAKKIEIGSLLLGMYDTAALKSSINTSVLTCNQAIAFAKLDSLKINTIFAYTLIQIGKEHFKSKQRGVRQKNLNLSMIKSLELIYPPIAMQNQFAQIVENIEAQKALAKQSLKECYDLFNGLVQKAFRGEL